MVLDKNPCGTLTFLLPNLRVTELRGQPLILLTWKRNLREGRRSAHNWPDRQKPEREK